MFNLIQVSKIVALISFIIGTVLFSLSLYLGGSEISIMVGLKFMIVAFAINGILLLSNLALSAICTENRIEYLNTCGIILLNIPIAFLYLRIIFFF